MDSFAGAFPGRLYEHVSSMKGAHKVTPQAFEIVSNSLSHVEGTR